MSDDDSMTGMLRESANDFLAGRADRGRLRGGTERIRGVDRALWQDAAALGWTGVMLPESLGGMGLSLAEATVLAEAMGRGLYAEPFVAACVMPSVLLAAAVEQGDAAQAEALCAPLLDGSQLLAVAWQARAAQLEPAFKACTVHDGLLSGRVAFVGLAEADAVLLVPALEAGRPVIVALDAGSAGVTREAFGAGLGSQAHWQFERARLRAPQALLAGDAALQALNQTLSAGRIAQSAELAGLAAGCLAQTLEHLRTRRQFDRPLGSFQSTQHRAVDLHVQLLLSQAAWQHALALWLAAPGAPATEAAVSAAKARCSDTAVRVGREAVQLHGAMGFCEEVDIGLYLRASLAGAAWLGGPTAHRRRFAATQASNPTAHA